MAWGGGNSFSFGSVYRFLSSSIATELKLDLSRIDQVIIANGEPLSLWLFCSECLMAGLPSAWVPRTRRLGGAPTIES